MQVIFLSPPALQEILVIGARGFNSFPPKSKAQAGRKALIHVEPALNMSRTCLINQEESIGRQPEQSSQLLHSDLFDVVYEPPTPESDVASLFPSTPPIHLLLRDANGNKEAARMLVVPVGAWSASLALGETRG